MDNILLTHSNTALDLYIKIHANLKWNLYVHTTVSKANQQLWLAIHTLGFNEIGKTKALTYISLCRSILMKY